MYFRYAGVDTDLPIKVKYYNKIPRLTMMTLRKQAGFYFALLFSFMEANEHRMLMELLEDCCLLQSQ